MAKCEICGKTPRSGHNVSFSERKTKRQFKPNLQRTKVWREGRLVPITVCAKCLKTLNKDVKVR